MANQLANAADVNSRFGDLESDANTARPVTAGGTGATGASGARTNLGLVIGTDVQAEDATLTSIAALGTAANKALYTTGVDTWAEMDVTPAGRALLADTTPTTKVIGELFPVWDHLTGSEPPDNSGTAKFVRLTAGQSGAGGYNEGLLTSESVSGSFPTVSAVATIAVGPMSGQAIGLINTEFLFLRAGATSGSFGQDTLQNITGQMRAYFTGSSGANGAFQYFNQSANKRAPGEGGFEGIFDFNASRVARTGAETRPKHRQATYYMRIV